MIPRVSVVMSVYNGEKYLKEAIDSILNQTFKDFEFIIVNDGSTDKTTDILQDYRDSRIITVTNDQNIGVPKSRNKALSIANGRYFAVMDAGDISLPQRLEKQVKFLDNHFEVGLVGSYYYIIDEEARELHIQEYPTKDEDIKKVFLERNCFGHGTAMFRRICLAKVGLYREVFKYSHDYDIILRISEHYQVANIDEPLYKWRMDPCGISIAKRVIQYKEAKIIQKLAKERRSNSKDRLQTANQEDKDKIFNDMLSQIKCDDKVVLADNYFSCAELFYLAGFYAQARSWLRKSFRVKLCYRKSLLLFLKIIICLYISPEIIKRIKFAKR